MAHDAIELHIGHQNVASSIAFSPDGRTLVSGGWDGAVKLWEVPTGSLLRTLDSGWTQVDAVAISPDGKVVVAAGEFEEPEGGSPQVRLWDADTGGLITAIDEWVNALAFSPDGEELYGFFFTGMDPSEGGERPAWDRCVVSSPEVIAWDARTGGERARLADSDARVRVACRRKSNGNGLGDLPVLSPDGGIALLVGPGQRPPRGSLELFDARNDVRLWEQTFAGEEILCAAISPNGARIASGARSGKVRLHDPQTGRVVVEWTGHEGWVRAVAFSPDGSLLASAGDDGTIRLREGEGLGPGRLLGAPRNAVRRIAIAPGGAVLASASKDQALRLWDLQRMSLRRTLVGHDGEITAVAFSPDGRTLASGGMDGTVRLWDGTTGASKRTLAAPSAGVVSLAFSADGSEIVAFVLGSEDPLQGQIVSWAVATGAVLRKRVLEARTSERRPGALSPDGSLLATHEYDSREVRLWDVASGTLLMTLRDDEDDIFSLAFSPDGGTLFGGGVGFRAILWDARSGSALGTFRLHRDCPSSVAFHPDGRSLVLGTHYANWVTRWGLGTGRLMRTYSGHRHAVRSLAWSPGGDIFASGSDDGTVKLWHPDTGDVRATLAILPPTEGQEVSHDWVALLPGGRFHGSADARRFLRRRVGEGVVPVEESSFEDWVSYVFDHPVTEPAWYFAEDAALREDGFQDTVPFLTRLLENPGFLPDRFTPGQINQGLWFLVSDTCSDHMLALLDEGIPWSDRRRCVEAIATLFETLFAEVCTDRLGHLDRGPTPPEPVCPLNLVCYMWWDLFPTQGAPDDPSRAELDGAILAVLRTILHLPSVACRESALHGLGHWQMHYPDRVGRIIDEFLGGGDRISPELREYALNARSGGIQ